jgi:UDP-N-acetylglucosamine 1-carboxyvinyltransferase
MKDNAFVIFGGKPLYGEIQAGGAKNAALPILAAAVLNGSVSTIENCPDIADIGVACEILESLGCIVKREGDKITVDSTELNGRSVSKQLTNKMRASVIFAGALLGRTGEVRIFCPGGCKIGERPINYHLDAFAKLGAAVVEEKDCEPAVEKGDACFSLNANRLLGAQITLPFPSVGATQNTMLAAAKASGITIINNPAREPEIVDLQNFLNACGAMIQGAGESRIVIKGVQYLHGASHRVMPDRIAAGTFLCAATAAGGEITVHGANYIDLLPLIEKLEICGSIIRQTEANGVKGIYVKSPCVLRGMGEVVTLPHPGYPTDLQAQLMAVAALSEGETVFRETIFEFRTGHIVGLNKMGAKIDLMPDGRTSRVKGVTRFTPAEVEASDLRGGAALIIAGLCADGKTVVANAGYVMRGYERIERTLRQLGADIELI